MIQNVLRAMGGVENYGIISVCLFFLVFISTVVWAFAQKKSLLKTMSSLPLENDFEGARAPSPASSHTFAENSCAFELNANSKKAARFDQSTRIGAPEAGGLPISMPNKNGGSQP